MPSSRNIRMGVIFQTFQLATSRAHDPARCDKPSRLHRSREDSRRACGDKYPSRPTDSALPRRQVRRDRPERAGAGDLDAGAEGQVLHHLSVRAGRLSGALSNPDLGRKSEDVRRAERAVPSTINTRPALAAIDAKRVLDLEQRSIRTPSSTFEEGNIADLYADYMSDIGLEVEMQQVTHPFDPKRKSCQPIGRLEGTGGGPTLLINGHMDPGVEMSGWSVDPYAAKFEDGWIWGMGAHDDKGGCVAAICALEAIVRSGIRLKGDVLMTPVVAHKLGGAGTRALLRHGVKADLCINMEHSNNTIANICVGRDGAVRLLGPRAVFPLQPGSARRLYQSDRAADGNRATDRSKPDADRR